MDTPVAAVAGKECEVCNICLGDMANPQVTPCNHQFCEPCLTRWLQTLQSSEQASGTCPVCRTTITEFQPQRLDRPDREAALAETILPNNPPQYLSERAARLAEFELEMSTRDSGEVHERFTYP